MTSKDIVSAQMAVANARVLRCHAEIVSGHYKTRRIFRAKNGVELELTHEEKLGHIMGTMDSHIRFMSELEDAITSLEGQEE
jgi:hypothetical protein